MSQAFKCCPNNHEVILCFTEQSMKHLNKTGKETDNCDGTKGNDEVYEVLDNYNIYDVPPERMYSNDDVLATSTTFMNTASKQPAAETRMVTNTAYKEAKYARVGVHETLYDNDTEGASTRVNRTLYDNDVKGAPTETLYDNGTEGVITLTDPDAVLVQHATYEVMNPPAADIYDDVMGHETSTVLSNKLALQKDECDDYI